MKSSIYNIYFSDAGNNYIFNTWHGSLISVDDNLFEQFINKESDSISKEKINELIKYGFLTEVENEYETVVQENEEKIKRADKLSVVIEPTLKCNAKCPYCFEKGVEYNDLDEGSADNIINYIIDNSVNRQVHITWFGGEPLVNPEIISYICKKLHDKNVRFYSTMITNGYLLDSNIENFEGWNLKRIQITLDDLFEKFDRIKNIAPNSFIKIIKNIHKTMRANIKVSIRVNFNSENYANYKSIIKFVFDEFKNNVNLYFHDIIGASYKTPFEASPNPLIDIYSELIKYGYIKNIRDMKIKRTFYACAINEPTYINVGPNGTVTKCEHYVGKDSMFNVGNINDPNFNPNKNFNIYRETCKKCVCFPICGGGCMANHLIREDAGCIRIKNCVKDLLKLYIKEKNNGNINDQLC